MLSYTFIKLTVVCGLDPNHSNSRQWASKSLFFGRHMCFPEKQKPKASHTEPGKTPELLHKEKTKLKCWNLLPAVAWTQTFPTAGCWTFPTAGSKFQNLCFVIFVCVKKTHVFCKVLDEMPLFLCFYLCSPKIPMILKLTAGCCLDPNLSNSRQ